MTFRIVTEPGARVAGLQTGELQGVEDLPTKSLAELKNDKNITHPAAAELVDPDRARRTPGRRRPTIWMFRKAVQAALDMDEIMQAASDGNYQLNVGFQYPNQPDYTDAGKETYNLHDPALAKKYLAQSGYKGEPVVLLTDKDYPPMYNSALVMQQQMKAVGINAQLKVIDWPTSVQISQKQDTGWNFFFTGWGTQPALGALATMQFFAQPIPVYRPPAGHPDPEVLELWNAMNTSPTAAERQEAFANMQKYVLDQVYAIPFGSLTKVPGACGPT